MSRLAVTTHSGAALAEFIPAISALRVSVFAEWPYLYVGTSEEEAKYLAEFATAEHALVVIAKNDAGEIVGCSTGSALAGHHDEFSQPLAEAGYDLASTYYFAESVLDPRYRGQGLGHAFFDERERFASGLGYKQACFCAVDRSVDHPRRPPDYRALDGFWRARGYQKLDGLKSHYDWPEAAGGPLLSHPMSYWLRVF